MAAAICTHRRREWPEERNGREEGGKKALLHFYTEREVGKEGVIYGARCSLKGVRRTAAAAALKQQHSNGLEE